MIKDQETRNAREEMDSRLAETGAAEPSAPLTAPYYTGIDWVSMLFRLLENLPWIALAALVGAAVMWFYTGRMVTPIYQATSKIYIAGSDTTISLSDLQLGSTLATDYQEVFKIWHIHEMVDERLDLDYYIDAALKQYREMLPEG